ncbi:MAG: glycerol-3-phosphate dehydrogenase/oxidase [Burkholderiaceae bacterium]|nr:glycerol-3-phosphate dehydrogenase/oxidase [Burkholderiaceae bacterium]
MPPITVPLPTHRQALLSRLAQQQTFDVAIVGGGATGLGIALDAAARGFSVVLLESHDFAKGTSSRATKLVHGGVRYLAQGNIGLVREALHERSTLLHNAPHLAQPLPFVMPSYKFWQTPFYGVGLKMYDALAGKAGLGQTEFLDRAQTLLLLPTAQPAGLKGGVKYWDGQYDDARPALALARTAASRGALLINYCRATGLVHDGGKVAGLKCQDQETGEPYLVRSRCVINATGVWVDELRRDDAEATGRTARPMVVPSQGVHLVVDRDFLPTDHALLVPKTADGRVLFAVPWLGKTILGTTDTPRHDLSREPTPFASEVAFILGEAGKALSRAPSRADVRSIWVGLRPLVKPQGDDDGEDNTKAISREHTVKASRSGLVTVTGGKWTTYRAMAEDVLQECFDTQLLERRDAGVTVDLRLVGGDGPADSHKPISAAPGYHAYGSEQEFVRAQAGGRAGSHAPPWIAGQARNDNGGPADLGSGLTEAMVRFAARYEYARTVEDVLARRHRVLFLDARLAAAMAPAVAAILREETDVDPGLDEFAALAAQYTTLPS